MDQSKAMRYVKTIPERVVIKAQELAKANPEAYIPAAPGKFIPMVGQSVYLPDGRCGSFEWDDDVPAIRCDGKLTILPPKAIVRASAT